jgi:hypothetical protein
VEILFSSIRNVLFALIILVVNIPIFWSFNGAMNFVKEVLKTLGIEI